MTRCSGHSPEAASRKKFGGLSGNLWTLQWGALSSLQSSSPAKSSSRFGSPGGPVCRARRGSKNICTCIERDRERGHRPEACERVFPQVGRPCAGKQRNSETFQAFSLSPGVGLSPGTPSTLYPLPSSTLPGQRVESSWVRSALPSSSSPSPSPVLGQPLPSCQGSPEERVAHGQHSTTKGQARRGRRRQGGLNSSPT